MRAKLSDSCKIRRIENGGLIDRRNVLMGCGVCAALVTAYPFFGKSEAYAQYQYPLINAALRAIALAVDIWKILQPTEGRIIIINMSYVYQEGDVMFIVNGQKGVENSAHLSYRLPPRYRNTYEFHDGPYGTFPGEKNFCGITKQGPMAIPMYVES